MKVPCTLFEFYNGAMKNIKYDRCGLCEEVSQPPQTVNEELTIQLQPYYTESTVLRFPEQGNESFGARRSDLLVSFE